MLAAVHAPPYLTLPLAIAICAVLAWYASRLARPGVPLSRRWIRGTSMVLMLVALGLMLGGFSFVDRAADTRRYALLWTGGIFALLLVALTAVIDFINSMRLLAHELEDEEDQ